MSEEARAAARRLLGHAPNRRILDLGCGDGSVAVALAEAGATVIAVDADPEAVHAARARAESREVRIEAHCADLADLAFLRADSIDAAWSEGSLARVPDLARVFRQVHRVLKPGGAYVFTLPHPIELLLEVDGGGMTGTRPVVARSYFDSMPVGASESSPGVQPHTIGSVFTDLSRAGFRVDQIAEPEPPAAGGHRALVPPWIVWRARKEGS